MLFQIFLIAFSLFALHKTWRQYRAEKVSGHWFSLWLFLWICVIFVAVSPATTDVIAGYVGVGRGADLLVYVAVVVLVYGFARLINSQEKQRLELTELTRQIAIRDAQVRDAK